MRKTFNHEHLLTLDELPLLTEGNVMPNVRISEPADGGCGRSALWPVSDRTDGLGPQVARNAGDLPVRQYGGVGDPGRETAAMDGIVQLTGFASDRNTNLRSVTLHALGGPWRNWFLRSDADVAKAFEQSTLLGEAKLRRTAAGHSPGAGGGRASTTWWPWQRTPTAWWPARTWFA